jgi:predicted ABC-type ATPase
MGTVVSIRGTNGSGKSTTVRKFMAELGPPTRNLGLNGKLVGYQFAAPGRTIFVLGKYETDCGGLDTSFSYPGAADDVCQFLQDLVKHGDVIAEGVVAMSSYGIARLTGLAHALTVQGHHIVFALLDTAEEVCIERVKARRAAKGNIKPFNPANLRSKYQSIHKDQRKLEAAGYDCRMISSGDSLGNLFLPRKSS